MSIMQVVGIIDFGDISYCWRVAEVAIAMAYMMLLSWKEDPWKAGADVLVRLGLWV
jgi:Ser/Thr protein kinase RdoA (MazF antagonist)